jgi:hypothetical protein
LRPRSPGLALAVRAGDLSCFASGLSGRRLSLPGRPPVSTPPVLILLLSFLS